MCTSALLAGCGVADFAQKQADWNASHGMGSMNSMPSVGGPSAAEREQAETQRRIRQGEDLENEEARKAGFGPSPTAGMNCTTNTSSSGGPTNMTSSSHTSCHN
jgi:hypothetical protein